MKKDPFKQIREIIKNTEQHILKDIDNTRNPLLKMIKQDYKDLIDIQGKFLQLEAKYGVRLKIIFPKPPKLKLKSALELIEKSLTP